jgi:hypothetical protein
MNFKQAEERFKQLEAQFAAGKLTETDFKAQLKDLMVQDDKGSWWIIGYETKKWYRHNGMEWVQANPRQQWITYGAMAIFVIVITLFMWGILTSLSPSTPNGEPGPTGPQGEPGATGIPGEPGSVTTLADSTCTECHNDTALITSKKASWEKSLHGSGTAFLEDGELNYCAFCHSGAAFSAAVAAGQNFSQVESGDANPTHQDCRTCHQIHTTYTSADWALETNVPVALVISDATFDGGAGNLCANCHQARRYMANFIDKTDATKYTATFRFDTHHSVQADALMGLVDVNAALGVDGRPGAHYSMVENTCVGCHLGDGKNHTFEAQLSTCVSCHADATNFDINGYQTAFEEKVNELEAVLLAKGLIAGGAEGYNSVPGTYDAKTAGALFTYFLYEEDGSEGIHNPAYFTTLVDAALEALK